MTLPLISFLLVRLSEANQPPTGINLTGFPGYTDLTPCASSCIWNNCYNCESGPWGVAYQVGQCGTNACLCGHQSEALSFLQNCGTAICNKSADISSATSFFNAYCSSYLDAESTYSAQITTTEEMPSIVTVTSTGIETTTLTPFTSTVKVLVTPTGSTFSLCTTENRVRRHLRECLHRY
jgi:hypothetical protein